MRIFTIVNVARQINGEFVFVKIEKAFKDSKKAEEYLNSIENPRREIIQNSTGFSVECMCSYGIFDVEIED